MRTIHRLMVMAAMATAAAMLMAALALPGCVNVSKPLVQVDASGYTDGVAPPDTQVKPGDSDEVRQLKSAVASLQRQVSDLKEELSREKARRKAAEDRADRLEDSVKELQKQVNRAYGR
jgi:septal ring factor EnvC (AmiA/AmiB activator)